MAACRREASSTGNAGLGVREVGLGLGYVESRRGPFAESILGYPQAALLDPDVFAGVGQPLFGDADLRVALGHVGDQEHQYVVVVLHGSVQIGVGRFDGSPESAPEIQFPGQIGSESPLAVGIAEYPAGAAVLADSDAGVVAEGLLPLGEQVPGGNRPQGTGFLDPQSGNSQGQVLLVGRSDERIENRVVENSPPGCVVDGRGVQGRGLRVDPLLGHRGCRPAVIRADLEPIGKVLASARASGKQRRQGCHDARRLAPRPQTGGVGW